MKLLNARIDSLEGGLRSVATESTPNQFNQKVAEIEEKVTDLESKIGKQNYAITNTRNICSNICRK